MNKEVMLPYVTLFAGNLTISGSGFGSITGSVYLGDNLLETIYSWSDSEITAEYPTLPSGSYPVRVVVEDIGCSDSRCVAVM